MYDSYYKLTRFNIKNGVVWGSIWIFYGGWTYEEEKGINDGHPGNGFMEVFVDELLNKSGAESSDEIH